MQKFRDNFTAMYGEIWKQLTPYLWSDKKFSDDDWKSLVAKANEMPSKFPEMKDDAIGLSLCMVKAVERRQKEFVDDR